MWIPLETRTNFNKTKFLNKYFAYFTWAVVDGLRFNLGFKKADNVVACFILSGISFHNLGPKQDIV